LATTTERRAGVERDREVRRTTETKHATKTPELYVLVAAVVGALLAAPQAEDAARGSSSPRLRSAT
jgi:hypothetical protein